MKVTRDWFFANVNGKSPTNKQLALFGLRWPLPPHWLNRVIGREIGQAIADEFVRLHSVSKRKKKRARADVFSEVVLGNPDAAICDCRYGVPPWEECFNCPLHPPKTA